ncbi:DgyrCDS1929 [Dimorphilus gyrociliatus]|uniref:DgyrCDS1929 n=1 Tax=Dimorphilus gyrociliatus TaxID=2664684 RepID=A0A7I8VAJ3_9ANNE|nr:DgyrCDS1929 [Dimorphilus gyrociliatus]
MDIYRAEASFDWPQKPNYVLSFEKSDHFQLIDSSEGIEWWGVRRLNDNSIGFVPAKYLTLVERKSTIFLPSDHQKQTEKYARRLRSMKKSQDFKLADIYSLPPHMIQSFDSWMEGNEPLPAPPVDYEDRDDSNEDDSIPLSLSEWNAIVEAADHPEKYTDFPPPPEGLLPPPDYDTDDDEDEEGLTPAQQKQKSMVINPKYLKPAPEQDQHLIKASKLRNPIKESQKHQALHKELALNAKQGLMNVLRTKNEFQREIDKRRRDKKCQSAIVDDNLREQWRRLENREQNQYSGESSNDFESVLSKFRNAQISPSHT